MRIALPTAQGQMCLHFGHCEAFALVDADPETKEIQSTTYAQPPQHAPGVLPQWLAEQGVDLVITGGMGRRAQAFFEQYNISVLVGAPTGTPEEVVQAHLDGSLALGSNVCDH